ncbi:MAG: FAD-binding oxidoreductase [Thermoanaerobaculia bacterium]
MRIVLGEAAPPAVLAFITTIHCAIALLRKYRPRERAPLVFVPSILFVASPWYLSSPAWLAIAFASHIAWFIACEKLLPPARPAQPSRTPAGFVSVPVLGTFVQTPEIHSFRLKRPAGFAFKPGQFLMVRVQVSGKPVVRCYSITSAPSSRGYLEISVRNQGAVSRHLHETLVAGTTIDIRGPSGTFVYPDGNRPIVLVGGGIGVTPLLSMLRHGVDAQPDRSITLLLSVRTAADVPFAKELDQYSARHPNVRVVIALSGGSHDPRYLSGRIDRHALEAVLQSVNECEYMLCGPLAMIDAMKSMLESMGVPSSQIHFEKFETAVAGAAHAAVEEPWITLKQSGRKVKTAAGQTILDVCEGAGAPVPSMCRVGVCGTCRLRLVSGDVAGDFDGLDESDRASGYILPCVARPLSDCAVDA